MRPARQPFLSPVNVCTPDSCSANFALILVVGQFRKLTVYPFGVVTRVTTPFFDRLTRLLGLASITWFPHSLDADQWIGRKAERRGEAFASGETLTGLSGEVRRADVQSTGSEGQEGAAL